ncbi:hypothetical protein HQ403_02625 [Candidatus Kaiserbacteria bacterium]|nr:hypothetical protein [Candidatus Kaiserbacteria bacterium]
MNTMTGNQNIKLIGVFLIGVVVGSFSLWMWTATQDALSKETEEGLVINKEASKDQNTVAQNLNTEETQLYSDSIVVRNQAHGASVIVEKARFEEDGWVVIHEGTVSQIGNALGAVRFDAGEHSGVVELLRSTEVGNVYRAVLYRDNGDKEFSLDSDFPFLRDGNQPILTTFSVE